MGDVSSVLIQVAWQDTGGWTIVTDVAYPRDELRHGCAAESR